MGLKRLIFDSVSDFVIEALRLNIANRLTCNLVERISPVYHLKHNGQEYHFFCPNRVTHWRAETFFTKEPETIEWMDTFERGEVLFDIGANIGLYSLYAAKKGVRVVSFEPESQNYALLNKNIHLNQASDHVLCLNIALSDCDSFDYLYIPKLHAGESSNNFGEARDWKHRSFNPSFKQGVLCFSLDSFLLQFPNYFPTHIKIDVDGIESKIIQGAEKTLRDGRLKSLSIEINDSLPKDQETVKTIQSLGLKFLHKKHAQMFDNGQFKDVYNYVFVK